MKPFLLLASRADDIAADDEYLAYLRYCALEPAQLSRIRMEQGPLPDIDLSLYSGVIVGGSPFTSSDPMDSKSKTQLRVEHELSVLLDDIVDADFPFLGACYGVGTLGLHQGGTVDRTYGEPIGAVEIKLTAEGRQDPLLRDVPEQFTAFVGHKEACTVLPPNAVVLAGSATCPVQMFRIKENLYATQFHPELDADGLVTRIDIYRHSGYFPPEQAEQLMAAARESVVVEPMNILRNFAARYAA
ncbi:glutamine amidotransferase [bacterium RCC_150]